jgi:hypothetical protein
MMEESYGKWAMIILGEGSLLEEHGILCGMYFYGI